MIISSLLLIGVALDLSPFGLAVCHKSLYYELFLLLQLVSYRCLRIYESAFIRPCF